MALSSGLSLLAQTLLLGRSAGCHPITSGFSSRAGQLVGSRYVHAFSGSFLSGLNVDLPPLKGVLIDAAGTLLSPSEPMADVYKRYAQQYGCCLTPQEILYRYRRAYNAPWQHSRVRYVGDGKQFWRHIVSESTGCDCDEMFEQVYDYYGRREAWRLAPGAVSALCRLKEMGYRLAIVSNFDTRLRPLLQDLGVSQLFDEVVVSAEVGVEKPNPVIFEAALQRLKMRPEEVVHIGDDRRNDVWGARDAGIAAWLWGSDVQSFKELTGRLLYEEEGMAMMHG